HAEEEGAAEAVRAAAAHGLGADRARGGRPARAGRDQGHGPARPLRAAADRLRPAGAARGPGRRASARCRARRDRAPDGEDLRAARVAVTTKPLLAVDGDSLAHRAYHALPKSIRRADGRP